MAKKKTRNIGYTATESTAGVSKKQVLVTGAAGFVGSALTRRLLADGHSVHALVRPGSDTWRLADV